MSEIIRGDTAHRIARTRARYSRYDWIAWVGRDGVTQSARITADSLKTAMLATGTQGRFVYYESRTGISVITWWGMANNMCRQCLRGMR